MDRSIFFNERPYLKNKVQVSYLFLETISALAEKMQESTVEEVLVAALIRLGFKKGELTSEEIQSICDRLAEIKSHDEAIASKSAGGRDPSSGGGKKSFGQDYVKHMSKLGTAEKCLVTCGYDVDAARRMYCEVDKLIADAAITTYFENRWQELKTGFEACVFGFGGNMDGAADADHDMTSEEGMKSAAHALRSMGF